VLYRTFIFYVIITILYRFMGKREVGQLGIVDLIVSILIAELAAMAIENRNDSIFLSIVPIVTLVLIQVGMSYLSLKLLRDSVRALSLPFGDIFHYEVLRIRPLPPSLRLLPISPSRSQS